MTSAREPASVIAARQLAAEAQRRRQVPARPARPHVRPRAHVQPAYAVGDGPRLETIDSDGDGAPENLARPVDDVVDQGTVDRTASDRRTGRE